VDKRSLLALVLCLFIFLGWMFLSPKLFPPAPPAPKPAPTAQPPKPSTPAEATKTEPAKIEPAKTVTEGATYPEKPPVPLTSKYLDAVLTNKGAGLEGVTVQHPKPREKVKEGEEKKKNTVPVLHPYDPKIPHLAIRQVGGPDAIESLPWEVVEQKPDRVEYRYRLRNGVEINKVLVLNADHSMTMTLILANKNPAPSGKSEPDDVELQLDLLAVNGLHPDSIYRYEQYLMGVASVGGELQLKHLSELQKGEEKLAEAQRMPEGADKQAEIKSIMDKYFRISSGRREWFGVKNRFFTAAVMPDNAGLDALDYYEFRLSSPVVKEAMGGHPNISAFARTKSLRIGKAPTIMQFTIVAAPLEEEALQPIPGLKVLASYLGGCFLPFIKQAAAAILAVLKFVGHLIGNMGFGIIATTLLIRLCLFPLSLKSQRNALAMQQLAPKIQALKERYKDDQQKYGVEQMRLFKENKVNPVAGCLPVFIQMPIFIGMYSVFEMSIDLRQAPFIAWITDLSQPDRLFGPWKPFEIPLLITTLSIEAFNVLPILMTITWFLQAYFTPRSPDPQMAQQQKMMMWMPIIFGLTCYGLASGLSLYFLTNSLLSMGEQKIIKKYILKIDKDGKPLAQAEGKESR
jgi:YidC/Oxa1 family membrane protein insertase